MIWKFSGFAFVSLLTLLMSASYAQTLGTDHIISVDQLLKSPDSNVVILHVSPEEDYLKGHIPNALNIERSDIADSTLDYGGIIAKREQIEQFLSESGISPHDKIVVYDVKGGSDAARIWWVLRYYGHRNCALLDGAIDAWQDKTGKKLSIEVPEVEPTEYLFSEKEDHRLFATLQNVKDAMNDTNTILLDVRSWQEFTGEYQKKGAFQAGRIPTSIFLDWANAVRFSEGKTIKSIPELTEMFKNIGVTKDKRIIVYCQTGTRSSHTILVLSEILGFENVQNYDGSWVEWSFNKDLPISTGELPKKEKENKSDTNYWWLLIIPVAGTFFFLNRRRIKSKSA